jgi:hypothetical protein
MLRILCVLVISCWSSGFSSHYAAPSSSVQELLNLLHKDTGVDKNPENQIETVGRLCACYLIESKVGLPQEDDSCYINDAEIEWVSSGEFEKKRTEMIPVVLRILSDVAGSSSQFHHAAETCFVDFQKANEQ